MLVGQLADVNAALESLRFNIGDDADAAGLQVNVNDGGFFHPDIDGDGVPDNAMSASASIGSPIELTPRSAGDLDDDGSVLFTDFLILSESFGTDVDPFTAGDINGDGTVSFEDFLVLSENFGKTVDELFAQA